jgi:hypothetical protein
MLEALELYGRLGTTKPEIIMYVLRSWLWDNEGRLGEAINAKDAPFGSLGDGE